MSGQGMPSAGCPVVRPDEAPAAGQAPQAVGPHLAGRSIKLAPQDCNCSVHDTGNMEALIKFGTAKLSAPDSVGARFACNVIASIKILVLGVECN